MGSTPRLPLPLPREARAIHAATVEPEKRCPPSLAIRRRGPGGVIPGPKRLRGLEALRLLEQRRLLHAEPAVYLGLRSVQLDLRRRKFSASSVVHTTAATWLSLEPELEDDLGYASTATVSLGSSWHLK